MNRCCKKANIEAEKIVLYPCNFHRPIESKFNPSNNKIRTTKYRFYNFIFLNLFEQFKRYSNVFFVITAFLNFIPEVGAFAKETALIPILFILIITLVKDGIEDFRRYLSDREINNRTVLRFDKDANEFGPILWQDIMVGDFIKISANERIPADLLLYYSSDVGGNCFIETANIDGETTLKQRSIIRQIDDCSEQLENYFSKFFFEVESPNKEIYKFNGNLIDDRSNKCVQSLKYTNLVLRDTILRNTDEIRGIVIYTGNETKIFMNSNKARFKRSMLEDQLNFDMLMCLIILLIICFMTAIGCTMWFTEFNYQYEKVLFLPNTTTTNAILRGFYQFWSSIIIFQSVIPISLYITMELVKAHQILHISSDLALYNETEDKKIIVKAYNITEDMGQIKHMFCDKTGTLTDNVMIFRKASISGNHFWTEEYNLKLRCNNGTLPMTNDIFNFLLVATVCNTIIIGKTGKKEKKLIHFKMDEKDSIVTNSTADERFSYLFDIPENFLIETFPPVSLQDTDPIPTDLTRVSIKMMDPAPSVSSYEKSNLKNSEIIFHRPLTNEELFPLILSESPDEDAIIKMAMSNGYQLHFRNSEKIKIWNAIEEKWMDFDILKVLPFDCVRKCMSVIVRDVEKDEISLHCKGADSVMFQKIGQNKSFLKKAKSDVFSFASDGLRTLVMGKRILSKEEYQKWEELFNQAEENFIDNENNLANLFSLIENNLELIGVIGLEDKLQENVPEVLECFKEAGINIWILTGDKKETATSIAHSAKLFAKDDIIFEITGNEQQDLENELYSIRYKIEKSIFEYKVYNKDNICKHEEFGLVVDGAALSIILSSVTLQNTFLHIAYFCNSVVCCRCTPTQKGEIVQLIKLQMQARTLAVGDGGNDVNMIQIADIGVGISGKEGTQAVMNSDFGISKFKYLKRLVLVHGHWSYDKLARMSLYMFYKNMFLSMVLFFYQIFCGFSAANAIDQVSQIIFHLIHTGVPPLIYGIWDIDFSDAILMANPQIYKTGINSKMYRQRDFWRTILDSIWQAICAAFIPWLCYRDTEIGMSELGIVSLSCIVVTMFSHLLIESKHWSPFHWAVCLGSLGIGLYLELYIVNVLCVVVFDCNTDNPYKVLHYVLAKGKTYLVITVTTASALFPRLLMKGILLESRDSIYYEAHRRMTKQNIVKWSTNISSTMKYDTYQFNYRDSLLYLGDLEKYKKIECKKCKYRNTYYPDPCDNTTIKHRKSQIVPLQV